MIQGISNAVAARQGAAVGSGTLPPGAYRQLVAPVHAALRASGLNARPFYLAALIVEASLVRGRQYVHVLNARQLGELYGFSTSDIADILNGRTDSSGNAVVGLIEAKILRRVELPLDKGWLLVVNPDWSQWSVPMMHSPAGKARWLGLVDAQARELERQLVADEIEWQFPDLTALLSAVDVENALRLLEEGKSYVVAPSQGAHGIVGAQDGQRPLAGLPARPEGQGDALDTRKETMRPGVARPSCGVAAGRKDALEVQQRTDPRADVAPRSEIPNAKPPAKPRGFGISEPPLRLKTQDQRLKINLKSWMGYSIEQKKDALIQLKDCSSDDQVRRILNTILGDDVTARDAGKWIKARWTQRPKVQQVMEMVVERMGQTHLQRVNCAGSLAHSYGRSIGVNFSRNLLKHQS